MAIEMGNEAYISAIKLHYKENKTLAESEKERAIRRENPDLDQMLYDADKAELLQEIFKAKEIMMKLARGEALTQEEEEMLEEEYPEFKEQAEKAKAEAERIKEQMKSAKSGEERQAAVAMAYSMLQSETKANSEYALVLGESIKKVLAEGYKEDSSKEEHLERTLKIWENRENKVYKRVINEYEQNDEQYSLLNKRT